MTDPAQIELDGSALVALPRGEAVWRVASGAVEAYLATPQRRSLIALVPEGGQLFPLPEDAAADQRVLVAASGPARLVPAEAPEPASARHWAQLHGGLDGEDDPVVLMAAIAAFMRGLDARLASEAAQADLALRDRLALPGDEGTVLAQGLSAELAWLAERSGWQAGTANGALDDVHADGVVEAVRRAGLRARKVTLDADWLRRPGEPMVLRRGDALIAALWIRDGWRLRGEAERLTDADAFSRVAWTVHPPFAAAGGAPSSFRGMARFVLPDLLRAAPLLVGTGIALAVVGLAQPMATAALFDDVVPSGESGQLIAIGIALLLCALFTAAFGALRARIQLRLEGRGAVRLAAALCDHVLALPETELRDYSAGDANQRIENVEQVRALVTGLLAAMVIAALTAIVYFILLFSYDVRLALLGVALSIVSVGLVWIGRALQARPLREAARLDGELAGRTYELLETAAKLRTAAAEGRALARWRDLYVREQAVTAHGGIVEGAAGAVGDAYGTLTLILFYASIVWMGATLSPGLVLAFLAAFGTFQHSLVGLCDQLLLLMAARPLVERGAALLDAPRESAPGAVDPGRLTGAIEMSNVVFGYDKAQAPLINGLSMRVAPGEHVAMVGGSGSGKSTALRLLLGFERPSAGAITYDGQELGQLDLIRVRAQIGVVLQSSMLFSGTILDNIRGASDADLAACLDAAEAAGLGEDLQRMGMGIHTPVTEGGGMFSGGQRQRILIARALAGRPNILFFDEATSALDNATQAVVARTLDALSVTRITIAHRLSTVRNADRIMVMQGGRFVESGRYDELMALGGAFAALARRQLAED